MYTNVTLEGWKQRVADAQLKKGSKVDNVPGLPEPKNVPIEVKNIRPDSEDRINRLEQEMVVVKRQIYGSQTEEGMVRHIQQMEGKWENLWKDYLEIKRKYLNLLRLLGVDDPDIESEEKSE